MKDKNIITTILVLLIPIMIGLGLWVVFRDNQLNNSQDTTNNKTTRNNNKNPESPKESPDEKNGEKTNDEDEKKEKELSFEPQTYTSPSNNFQFSYPQSWFLTEAITDSEKTAGVFGDVISAWNISSFNPEDTPDTGGIPEGSIKVDFEVSIPKEGLTIDVIAQCDQPENDCENVKINGAPYTRVLNKRGQVPSVLYVSINNNMMYRASSLFGSQEQSKQLEKDIELFDEIASTFIQL